MKLTFAPRAFDELAGALAWYAERSLDVARSFQREVDGAVALLLVHPLMGAPGARGLRRLPLRRFPYTLHYRADSQELLVVAVAHQRRRPGYWR